MNLPLITFQAICFAWYTVAIWSESDEKIKKGQPGACSSRLRRVGEGSDHFGSIVRSLSLHFCKRLFPGLEPVTSWSQGSSFTTAPRLTKTKVKLFLFYFAMHITLKGLQCIKGLFL